MRNTIIVVANLGSFKAYKFDLAEKNSTPSLEPVEVPNALGDHAKRNNTLTVMERGSSTGTPNQRANGAASDGEQHNMELEKRRRAIKQIGDNVKKLLAPSQDVKCLIAAPKEILHQVLDVVDNSVRTRIAKAVALDLTGTPKSQLVGHFYPDGIRIAP